MVNLSVVRLGDINHFTSDYVQFSCRGITAVLNFHIGCTFLLSLLMLMQVQRLIVSVSTMRVVAMALAQELEELLLTSPVCLFCHACKFENVLLAHC